MVRPCNPWQPPTYFLPGEPCPGHFTGVVSYGTCSTVCPNSLSTVFLRAPTAARASTSRLWMNERRCIRWGHHVCSIHLALTGTGAVSAFQLGRECRRQRQSASFGVDTCFQSPGSVLRRGLSGSRGTSASDLLRKHQAVFHNSCPTSHSHQEKI